MFGFQRFRFWEAENIRRKNKWITLIPSKKVSVFTTQLSKATPMQVNINPEEEQAKREFLESERREIERIARIRTAELAQTSLKVVKISSG